MKHSAVRWENSEFDTATHICTTIDTNLLSSVFLCSYFSLCHVQNVSGGEVNILGGHSIGHAKQKYVSVRVSYSERFPK
jgi:hypothetical protein